MPKRRESRPHKAHRIARLLARRYEIRRGGIKRPLVRRQTRPQAREIIAYDFETTPIGEGTPTPLYLTAYGREFHFAGKVESYDHLRMLLRERFLIDETNRHRFVAWNGNHFDAYFIARALLDCSEFELRPYFAKGNKLRGMRVIQKREGKSALEWEFLDGIAMTDTRPRRLAEFLQLFAPDFGKLKGPDFEAGETFEPDNPEHRKYAIRDSEGLWHGLVRAQEIMREHFGVPFSPTIGATGIRIFQRNMPEGVTVWQPPQECLDVIRRVVYRGGYCVAMRRFRGKVWKYDVNQCYAAAMRESDLPAGRAAFTKRRPKYVKAWIARIIASNPRNIVPFYYRDLNGVAKFSGTEIEMTWLTCEEIGQLEREGWRIEFFDFWAWEESFRMTEFVDRLERLRMTCEGGPSGAIGSMVKAAGNACYGKTVEHLDAIEIRLARERPEGYAPYDDVEGEIECAWFRLVEPPVREYHQPQIGAWITASARMKIRRAALLAPKAFLYADTDAAMFSRPVDLPLDKSKYGLWKLEADGEPYIVVTKKVYATFDGKTRHAKGLNLGHHEYVPTCVECRRRDRACGLTVQDFEHWHDGLPPSQDQLQRKNWLRFLMGDEMFVPVSKVGQIV